MIQKKATEIIGMSLNFISGGIGGKTSVDCRTLWTGELLEELSILVSSGGVELCDKKEKTKMLIGCVEVKNY